MKTHHGAVLTIVLAGFSVGTDASDDRIDDRSPCGRYAVPAAVADQLTPVDISRVTLGGEIGRRVDVTIHNNIRKLALHKNFTRHFEEKTGPNVAGGFVGMGMLTDAVVRFAAYSADPGLLSLKEQIIDTLIHSQLDDGYAGFYRSDRRLWNHAGTGGDNWDIHEMAFLIDGLVSDYQLHGNRRSLDAAVRTADYILERWDNMPENYAENVDMHVLDTGIDWAILRLYRLTGESRFLDFSERMKSLYDWETGIVIGRRPGVSGHMFAYLAMCVAQLELYRVTGKPALLEQTEQAIDFLLAQDGLTITGSAGQREIWTDDQDGEGGLGETCATAYQLRVYENLLRLTGQSLYGDLIERTVYNGLFGAQSPSGEQIRYYTPFEGPREYYRHEHMCCPGNFRRIIAELPGMLYYRTEQDGVAVNVYSASSVRFGLEDGTQVDLIQETDYPSSGRVTITVSPETPRSFPVALRIPFWVDEATVTVNGTDWDTGIVPGSFLVIDREWREGNRIEIDFAMPFRYVKGRKRNAGRVALMRGPVIYGLNLDANPDVTDNGKRSFSDLRRILLDPSTLHGPEVDGSVRPDGTAARISAWRESYSGKADRPHEFAMKLTEFPDPGNQFIYFKIPDYRIEVEDELVRQELLSVPLLSRE